MSSNIKSHLSRLNEGSLDPLGKSPLQPRRASTAPGQLAAMSDEQSMLLNKIRRMEEAAGAPLEVDIDDLVESPYQTGRIDPKRLDELVENLKSNPLVTPLTVRRRADKRLEIVSGHHRREAYRRLGRQKIQVIVIDISDEEALRLVFFANLISPALSEYEKFLGFAKIRYADPNKRVTLESLAGLSGLSTAYVHGLFSFERLPEEVLSILRGNPGLVGSVLASQMAELPSSMTPRCVEVLQMLARAEISQARAMDWIKRGGQQLARPAKPRPRVFKGPQNTTYAKVVRHPRRIVLDFSQESFATDFEAHLEGAIKLAVSQLKAAEAATIQAGEGGPEPANRPSKPQPAKVARRAAKG